MDLDSEFQTWREWIDEHIYKDVIELVAARQVLQEYREVVDAAPKQVHDSTGLIQTWITGMYTAKLAFGLRRQSEVSARVISLATLLDRIARFPQALSKERYLAAADTNDPELLAVIENYFDEHAIPSLDFIDPTIPSVDLARLHEATEPIRKYVNKGLAHYDRDKSRFKSKLKLQDLHEALDVLLELVSKYELLLRHTTIISDIAFPNWQEGFRVAWIAD